MIPTPRPYQRAGLDAIGAELAAGVNRQLLQSPTGTGKTVLFSALLEWPSIRAWLAQFPPNERHMLVIAHRKELLNQAAEKIHAANPDLLVTFDQAERRASVQSDVVVASIKTLASGGFARLQRLTSRMTFRVVIVDEAHHAAAPTYREVLARLGFLPLPSDSSADGTPLSMDAWDAVAPKDRLLVGVTATPNRSDAVGLNCVFQKIVFSYQLKTAIADGWLVPITPWAIETDTSLDDVRTTRGEFVTSHLSETVNTVARNQRALAAWVELAERQPTLVFSVDVAHAHALAEVWTTAGYRAKVVSGETPDDERADTLRAFQGGQLDAIMNCMVLTEGTDLPNVRCILHAAPTTSATLYEQKTGRGLRPLPGDPVGPDRLAFEVDSPTFRKPNCILIDLVDVARRHSLQSAPILYGLPPGLVASGIPLQDLERDWEKFRAEFDQFDPVAAFDGGTHLTLAQLQARAELVDIWKVQPLPASFGTGRALSWSKVDEDRFQMEYPWQAGYERVRVERDLLDRWTVTLRTTPAKDVVSGLRPPATELVIGAQVTTSDAAAGLAEAFVLQQRQGVVRLKSLDAPWRLDKPTLKQLTTLRRHRVPFHETTLTKGGACDLLNIAFRQKPLRR